MAVYIKMFLLIGNMQKYVKQDFLIDMIPLQIGIWYPNFTDILNNIVIQTECLY